MYDDPVDEFLIHFGVKGMRWGVTRQGGSTNPVSVGRKRTKSGEHEALRAVKPKHAKELSDTQLKSAIGRMQLEKQYNSLNPHGLSKANKVVLAALAVGTTANAAYAFSQSATGKAIASGVKKAISAAVTKG